MVKWLLLASGLYLLYEHSRKPRGPRKIVTLGDSITAGPYPRHLARKLAGTGHSVIQMGYGGKGVKHISNKLDEVIAHRPTDVVLLIGVNDIASDRSPEYINGRLDEIYNRLDAAGIPVTAIPVLPWGSYRKYTPAREKAMIAVNQHIAVAPQVDTHVDVAPMAQGKALHPSYTNDKLHPNQLGSEILADLVVDALF